MNLIIPKKISLISLFFFLAIIILPFADNLTGVFFKLKIMSEGSIGSPSQIMRFFLILLVLAFVNIEKFEQPMKITLIIFSYLLMVETTIACVHFNFIAFISGILFSLKLLFTVSCYFYISYWIDYDKQRTVFVIKQLINYGTVVATLVLVSYFSGFYISNYNVGIATRGLFISGNGLGSVLGISTILLIYFTKKITFFSLFHISLLILTTALLGTKASLVYLLFSLFLLMKKLLAQKPFLSIFFGVCFCFYILIPLIDILGSIFENIIYKFNHIDNKLTLIASSRDVFIRNALSHLNVESYNVLRILFGGGAYYAYTDYTTMALIKRKYLENDLFELFFSYGITAVIVHFGSFIFSLNQCFNRSNMIIGLSLTLLFLSSITMGLLYNGTSAITYAICLAIASKGTKVEAKDF